MGVVKEGEGGGGYIHVLFHFKDPDGSLKTVKPFQKFFFRKKPIPNPNLAVHNNLAHPNPFSGKVYF